MARQRKTPLKRSRIKQIWDDAEVKRTHCRICGPRPYEQRNIQLAHLIGKHFQDQPVKGPRGAKRWWVDPDSVIPLCAHHHMAYDQRNLSLKGYLSMRELRGAIAACKKFGIDVRRRLYGVRL